MDSIHTISPDVSSHVSPGGSCRTRAFIATARGFGTLAGRYLVRSGSVYLFQIRMPEDIAGKPACILDRAWCADGRAGGDTGSTRPQPLRTDQDDTHGRTQRESRGAKRFRQPLAEVTAADGLSAYGFCASAADDIDRRRRRPPSRWSRIAAWAASPSPTSNAFKMRSCSSSTS